jgi:hypothetical protein
MDEFGNGWKSNLWRVHCTISSHKSYLPLISLLRGIFCFYNKIFEENSCIVHRWYWHLSKLCMKAQYRVKTEHSLIVTRHKIRVVNTVRHVSRAICKKGLAPDRFAWQYIGNIYEKLLTFSTFVENWTNVTGNLWQKTYVDLLYVNNISVRKLLLDTGHWL